MPQYKVTHGTVRSRVDGGFRVSRLGQTIKLTEAQAAPGVEAGTLVRVDAEPDPAPPASESDSDSDDPDGPTSEDDVTIYRELSLDEVGPTLENMSTTDLYAMIQDLGVKPKRLKADRLAQAQDLDPKEVAGYLRRSGFNPDA